MPLKPPQSPSYAIRGLYSPWPQLVANDPHTIDARWNGTTPSLKPPKGLSNQTVSIDRSPKPAYGSKAWGKQTLPPRPALNPDVTAHPTSSGATRKQYKPVIPPRTSSLMAPTGFLTNGSLHNTNHRQPSKVKNKSSGPTGQVQPKDAQNPISGAATSPLGDKSRTEKRPARTIGQLIKIAQRPLPAPIPPTQQDTNKQTQYFQAHINIPRLSALKKSSALPLHQKFLEMADKLHRLAARYQTKKIIRLLNKNNSSFRKNYRKTISERGVHSVRQVGISSLKNYLYTFTYQNILAEQKYNSSKFDSKRARYTARTARFLENRRLLPSGKKDFHIKIAVDDPHFQKKIKKQMKTIYNHARFGSYAPRNVIQKNVIGHFLIDIDNQKKSGIQQLNYESITADVFASAKELFPGLNWKVKS